MECHLPTDLARLIGLHADAVNALQGCSAEETEIIKAGLCRVLDHILNWTPIDHETSEKRIGGLETGFVCLSAEWLCGCTTGQLHQDKIFDVLRGWQEAKWQQQAMPVNVSERLLAVLQQATPMLEQRQRQFAASSYSIIVAKMLESMLQLARPTDGQASALVCDDLSMLEEPVAMIAFAFGTGSKVGDHPPALVGPGLEMPGSTNCGLAGAIRKVMRARPMPVYAQWEVADALLYGPFGSPDAASFARWDLSATEGDGRYSLKEHYPVDNGNRALPVTKAVPLWPRAVRDCEISQEAVSDPAIAWRYYLGSPDVLAQLSREWSDNGSCIPASFLLIGHPDHVARCAQLFINAPEDRIYAGRCVAIAGPTLMPQPDEWQNFGCDSLGYDPLSTQPWTRNRAMFLIREMIVRCGNILSEVYRPDKKADGGHTLYWTDA